MGRSSPFVSLAEEQRRRAEEPSLGPPIPFFILTGFLGVGKTTLLNRVLRAPQGRRIAVLVNDVGAINVDRKLLAAEAGDLIELSGGCVCCQVDLQRDLFSGVDDLIERARPDLVVLETTGIADPRVLLAAFDELADRRRRVFPAGVACVLDVEMGLEGEARVEWRAQVEAADRFVLTKLDRALPAGQEALHARLAKLNPRAERAAFPQGEEGTQALARFLLEPRAQAPSAAPRAHAHSQLSVYAFSEERPLLERPLLELVESLGSALVRAKGFVRLAAPGQDRWAYLERAGRQLSLSERAPPEGETRSELVFILESGTISEDSLRRRLWACRAGTGGAGAEVS